MTTTSTDTPADPAASAGCGCGPDGTDEPCAPCVASLSSPADRLAALRAALEREPEPLVSLTHLLHLCRDQHPVLWEHVGDPAGRARAAALVGGIAELIGSRPAPTLEGAVRRAMAAALDSDRTGVPAVVAYALAQLIDDRYGHTFAGSFRARGPYQPGVGDPVPLDTPDLRAVIAMRPTSPPWRLANRLDQTRRVRLAGEWVTQFRVIFDYSLFDHLTGLIDADTVVATCHPNRGLADFALTVDAAQRSFPVGPVHPDWQHRQLDRLIEQATDAGSSIVVLPELSVTEHLAEQLGGWVRRPGGPRLLVAGSYHHADPARGGIPGRRRNTAVAWVAGCDQPLTHDKHSPADRPVSEDIQPAGWPELRVYVTADGWHLAIAICRDLLNPAAVHALSEAGANLVLVPAMSETMVPFGGPAAQLVGSGQAIVAVANNPGDWSAGGDQSGGRPARAVFGHPGFGQQIRPVTSPDADPGLATLRVGSGQIAWASAAAPAAGPARRRTPRADTAKTGSRPAWVTRLGTVTRPEFPSTPWGQPVTLRPAAVLVVVSDSPAGPQVLVTERADDLADYPATLTFPGGAAEAGDSGPAATALREAAEEVGLDPASVEILGALPSSALPETGFAVTPVLAWSAQLTFSGSVNQAEVASLRYLPLGADLSAAPTPTRGYRAETGGGSGPDEPGLGRMTATVIELLRARLNSSDRPVPAGCSAPPPDGGEHKSPPSGDLRPYPQPV